jgi:hypothetical protein
MYVVQWNDFLRFADHIWGQVFIVPVLYQSDIKEEIDRDEFYYTEKSDKNKSLLTFVKFKIHTTLLHISKIHYALYST